MDEEKPPKKSFKIRLEGTIRFSGFFFLEAESADAVKELIHERIAEKAQQGLDIQAHKDLLGFELADGVSGISKISVIESEPEGELEEVAAKLFPKFLFKK